MGLREAAVGRGRGGPQGITPSLQEKDRRGELGRKKGPRKQKGKRAPRLPRGKKKSSGSTALEHGPSLKIKGNCRTKKKRKVLSN